MNRLADQAGTTHPEEYPSLACEPSSNRLMRSRMLGDMGLSDPLGYPIMWFHATSFRNSELRTGRWRLRNRHRAVQPL